MSVCDIERGEPWKIAVSHHQHVIHVYIKYVCIKYYDKQGIFQGGGREDTCSSCVGFTPCVSFG